jgi:glycosyltransferase involved in cell wall biosynthesis
LIGVIDQALWDIPAIVSIRGNREYRLRGSGINRLLVPAIYRHARYLTVQSPRMLDDLRAQLASAGQVALSEQLPSKIKVIPNGIRIPQVTRSHGTRVVYVGRLIKNKGVADLLAALKALPDAEMLVVGDGPDRGRLEALAQGMRVTFTGQVAPSAVIDHLQQARVLVLPSHLGDGLPNVILEAMACGVPVVATRTAGIPDVVHDGETGLLFEMGDIQQMTAHIHRLLTDDALWQRLGEHSLQAVQAYSWDVILPSIEQLLAQAISSGGKSTSEAQTVYG